MTEMKFIVLKNLEVYRLARELSEVGWEIYEKLSWHDKKIMGDQFIESVDSVGANIAEGYGRYHYLDKIKFYYNGRASLYESCEHWLELLYQRKKIETSDYERVKELKEKLLIKLNNFINSTYKSKNKNE
ncbi:MAG TPA: four helix bundle protein [Elusimicrobia bacterium]|nr:four helix bundle protein [Elusimicrobiota bacterium]